MKKIIHFINKNKTFTKGLAVFALVFATYSANSACWCFFHQPEKPNMKTLRKFD